MDEVYNEEIIKSSMNLNKNLLGTDRIFNWT